MLDAAPKSPLHLQLSRPAKRGVGHRHERWGGMRWTRQRRRVVVLAGRASVCERTQCADERCCCVRQNRVVLTPQWLASSLRRSVGPTGRGWALIRRRRRQASPILRGDHDISRKTIAQGMSGCSVCTCMLVCVFCTVCARDRGCSEHPAFPAPSDFLGHVFLKPRAHRAARSRGCIQWKPRQCERSDAIHSSAQKEEWIASSLSLLAMTSP